MNIETQFEDELLRRGHTFSLDLESGRHVVEVEGWRMLISLDNLRRDVAADGDVGRIVRFVDSVVASVGASRAALSADRLYWCVESSDYEERAEYRFAMSNLVDRVLVHWSAEGNLVTWVTPSMLESLKLSEADAGDFAFRNLGRALSEASVESQDIDGVKLGYINTSLPFKASLILAPNLREVIGAVLGWPIMAVIPDRNFLYFWAAQHTTFIQRVGGVVVREYSRSSYPLSTEVYEITDNAIRAIGEFPKNV